jgi:hypothetical protein
VRNRDSITRLPPEEHVHGDLGKASHEVMGGDVEERLRVRMADE